MFKPIDSYFFAYISNDLDNLKDYMVIDGECYYKGDCVGKIKSKITNGITQEIYYYPYSGVKSIEINMTITPTGVTFNE